jgi:hypothetical protein
MPLGIELGTLRQNSSRELAQFHCPQRFRAGGMHAIVISQIRQPEQFVVPEIWEVELRLRTKLSDVWSAVKGRLSNILGQCLLTVSPAVIKHQLRQYLLMCAWFPPADCDGQTGKRNWKNFDLPYLDHTNCMMLVIQR